MEIKAFDQLSDASGPSEEQTCKGLVFRGHASQFFDYAKGRLVKKEEIRLLKRASCPGCQMCAWFLDDMRDMVSTDALLWPAEIEEGALYTIRVADVHKDWESGMVDDYKFEVVEKEA